MSDDSDEGPRRRWTRPPPPRPCPPDYPDAMSGGDGSNWTAPIPFDPQNPTPIPGDPTRPWPTTDAADGKAPPRPATPSTTANPGPDRAGTTLAFLRHALVK